MKTWTLMLLIAVSAGLYLTLLSSTPIDQNSRQRLSAVINSEYQEVRPLVSPDGNTLYFSRRNHPGNNGGTRDFQDIWVSHFNDNQWSEPEPMAFPINNKKANTLCSVTADGSYLILLDSYRKVKTPVAQAFDSPAGWGAPDDLVINNFANSSSYYDFFYHEQTEVLLMAIDNGQGNGEQDIHVSFKDKDGTYSAPVNIGNAVNTGKPDFAPFLAADGRTLYFASFGHNGLGGSDLFVAYRMDDSWKSWTTPLNLGPGINSVDDENYISVTGDFSLVYFESYPEGSRSKDIYRAVLPMQFHPESLAPSATDEGLLTSGDHKEKITNNTGFSINTGAPGLNQEAQAQALQDGENQQTNLTPTRIDQSFQDLEIRQYLEDGRLKSKVLQNSYFGYNSYQLSTDCLDKLTEISQAMIDNPTLEAQLTGHADSWGTNDANMRISYLRALSTAHYLVDQGINGRRLQVLGIGDSNPLASNDDEKDGRELNRRVEITLFSPAGTQVVYILR